MAKLVLKGVMWGVDKVPDTWFEKVPGNYYKPRDENGKVIKQQTQHKSQSGHKDMKHRRSTRRRSEDYGRRREDDYDDGYRSDGHGRRSSRKKSQDRNYDLANDRPRRERSRTDQYRADKRRSYEQHRDDQPMDGLYSYHDGPVGPPANGAAVAAAAASGAAAERGTNGSSTNGSYTLSPVPGAPQQPQPFLQQPSYRPTSTSTLRGGISTGYVPYADIYGGPVHQPPNNAPMASDTSSVPPNSTNQVPPPVAKQPYKQNPYAQDAPAGNQPGYLPDPHYNDVRRYDSHQDDRSHPQYDRDDAEPERRHPRSQSQRRRSYRDDHSSSEDSYDSRRGHRRARSERRGRRDTEMPPSRGSSHRYR